MRKLSRATLLGAVLLSSPTEATAQNVGSALTFIAGGAVGLGLHEGGHLIFDLAFDASPGLRKVTFGPVPFFAITHEPVSPAREFTISSAGFWMQHLSSELILVQHPHLREERAALLKGVLAFNVLASAAYSAAAFAAAGPEERDTRGMAASVRMAEPWVGALVLVPAVLDAARYYRPEAQWVKWVSRAAKVGGVLLLVRARGSD